MFRQEIFEEVSASHLYGLIFTYVWAFDCQEDWDYVKQVTELFESKGGMVYYVELEAVLEERLQRNKGSNRLEHKPSKRDLTWSEQDLLTSVENYRLNSVDGEIQFPNYIKIESTNLSAEDVAKMVQEKFRL